MTDEDLIIELGLEGLDEGVQQRAINDLNMQVGEAAIAGLSDEEIDEYEQITNGNQEVIDRWLQENTPNYKETIAYQQLSEGYDEDPEKVPADKVFASMAWIEKKNPDLAEKIAAIKANIKANLDRYK